MQRVSRASCAPPAHADAFALTRVPLQPHYERLADGVAVYVQALLLTRHGLQRRMFHGVDVYASPDADTAPGLLVRLPLAYPAFLLGLALDWKPAPQVLLCGAGVVAAGQWARRLCINESLTTGSVMPYIGALALSTSRYSADVCCQHLQSGPRRRGLACWS